MSKPCMGLILTAAATSFAPGPAAPYQGTKRRQTKPKSDNENIIEESNVTTNISHDAIVCKRPKREVGCSNFNEKAFDLII